MASRKKVRFFRLAEIYLFLMINYLNRGALDIDIVALGIDIVAMRAWAQSRYRLE